MSMEEKRQLKKVLDVKEKGVESINYKFNKHLHKGSRYNEMLDVSDDEGAFNTKPITKDGVDYELDFKIDAYRENITLKRPGHDNKLMGQTNAAELIKMTMRGKDSQRTKMLSFADGAGNVKLDDRAFATLQS